MKANRDRSIIAFFPFFSRRIIAWLTLEKKKKKKDIDIKNRLNYSYNFLDISKYDKRLGYDDEWTEEEKKNLWSRSPPCKFFTRRETKVRWCITFVER